jgi:hypothetical protein
MLNLFCAEAISQHTQCQLENRKRDSTPGIESVVDVYASATWSAPT